MSGINRQSDDSASIQIGPTDQNMVRLYVASDSVDLPLDFTPDEAREIAEELIAAAEIASNQQR